MSKDIRKEFSDVIYPTMVIRTQAETIELQEKEIQRLNNIINELHSDLKTLWIVLWNMDTEMTGYQNEIYDKYYDEFHKGSDKE